MVDIWLVLLSLFAGITTFLLIAVHITWVALMSVLRKRGCKVTYLRHDWRKIRAEIAAVAASPEDRHKYEKWESVLHYIYLAWAMAMALFVLMILFVYN